MFEGFIEKYRLTEVFTLFLQVLSIVSSETLFHYKMAATTLKITFVPGILGVSALKLGMQAEPIVQTLDDGRHKRNFSSGPCNTIKFLGDKPDLYILSCAAQRLTDNSMDTFTNSEDSKRVWALLKQEISQMHDDKAGMDPKKWKDNATKQLQSWIHGLKDQESWKSTIKNKFIGAIKKVFKNRTNLKQSREYRCRRFHQMILGMIQKKTGTTDLSVDSKKEAKSLLEKRGFIVKELDQLVHDDFGGLGVDPIHEDREAHAVNLDDTNNHTYNTKY